MNKIDEKHIWTLVMTIVPVVLLGNLGGDLVDDTGMSFVYAGMFGGIGGLIGFFANHFTKDKNRVAKVLVIVAMIAVSGLIIFLVS